MYIGQLSAIRSKRFKSLKFPTSQSIELVLNGNFAQGMSGWTSVGSVAANTSQGTCKMGPSGSSGGYYQDATVPANSPLDVRVVARQVSGTSGSNVWASPTASFSGVLVVSSANYQEFYWRLTSSTGVARIYLQIISGDSVMEVQSASIRTP